MGDSSEAKPGTRGARSGTPKILCVDDEPQVLQGLQRTLGFEFEVVTEGDPAAGLQRLVQEGDFQVVVSDLKMPGIDGTRFLYETKRILPAATRLLLTGVPDLASAIAAINEGGVFRFLTKPCAGAELVGAVQEAVDQHRLSLTRDPELDLRRGTGGITWLQRRLPARVLPPVEPLVRRRSAPLAAAPAVSQVRQSPVRSGSHLAVLAAAAEKALEEGRARDAERTLEAPLRAILSDAEAGMPMDRADIERAAVLAARLAAATRDGSWLDYPFVLFGALRRLLPSQAIDEIQAALHHVRGTNVGALQLYLSRLEVHGCVRSSSERCLLKRIQQCRALMALSV